MNSPHEKTKSSSIAVFTELQNQDILQTRNRLKEILLEKSLILAPPDRPFVLSSGLTSTYYIDGKKTTCDPEGMYCLAKLIFMELKDLPVEAIGGPTLGADPMATAVSLLSFTLGNPIPLFIVRKEPKKHGTREMVEGTDIRGKRVVMVEDVVTTGASVLKAIEVVRELNCEVLKVIVLVDREQGGQAAFQKIQIPYSPLFMISELLGK